LLFCVVIASVIAALLLLLAGEAMAHPHAGLGVRPKIDGSRSVPAIQKPNYAADKCCTSSAPKPHRPVRSRVVSKRDFLGGS
jgi:hypothetical protein